MPNVSKFEAGKPDVSKSEAATPELARPDAAQVFETLRAIVAQGALRRGSGDDAVCGVVPELYVEPADEAELSGVLRYANEARLAVCPRGGGTKLGWGNAPGAIDLAVSTARFNRILEYAPHDMTVTAGAGVTIAQLQSALAKHRQRLALDPLWPSRATVGGVIATNDSGALRLRYGSIRDLILGVTVVLADGTIAVSGGKVVKNVAGYDLPKLMSGAFGTLGVITRAVFRLHPLPHSSKTLTFAFADCERANEFILAVANSLAVPSGIQMRAGAAGPTASVGTTVGVDVRIDGIPAGIDAQMETVRKLAPELSFSVPDCDPWQAREQLWHAADPASTLVIKLGVLPNQLGSTANFVRETFIHDARAGGQWAERANWTLLMYSTGLGWLRIGLMDAVSEAAKSAEFLASLRKFLAPAGGSAVLLEAPAVLRDNLGDKLDAWGGGGSALPLMAHIKQQFDPRGILNRGRFVGGI